MVSGARYLLCMVPVYSMLLVRHLLGSHMIGFCHIKIRRCRYFRNDIDVKSLKVLSENLEDSQFYPVITTHELHIVSHHI